ncbi:MAG: hypothetical protein ACOY3Y_10950, partial [Acidobacteriota bacterium]
MSGDTSSWQAPHGSETGRRANGRAGVGRGVAWAIGAALVATLAVSQPSALAHFDNAAYGPGAVVGYRVNTSSVSSIANATVAIWTAAQAWYVYTQADVAFDYVGSSSATFSDWDNACQPGQCGVGNLVVGDATAPCSGCAWTDVCAACGTAQVFALRVNTNPACTCGWTADLPSSTSQRSLQELVVHALGVGLGTPNGYGPSVPISVMNSGATGCRGAGERPHHADAEALRAVYGDRPGHAVWSRTTTTDGQTWTSAPFDADV